MRGGRLAPLDQSGDVPWPTGPSRNQGDDPESDRVGEEGKGWAPTAWHSGRMATSAGAPLTRRSPDDHRRGSPDQPLGGSPGSGPVTTGSPERDQSL